MFDPNRMWVNRGLDQVWPSIAERITLRTGSTDLVVELRGATIPEVGNIETPRFSTLILSADLPRGTGAITFGWDASLGSLILRQQGVEDGYTAFLEGGQLSAPMPRGGTGPMVLWLAAGVGALAVVALLLWRRRRGQPS